MKRKIYDKLIKWKEESKGEVALLIDGARRIGKSYIVEPMSKAALVAGADGLIIEVHTNPSQSLCDSAQTIDIESLKRILEFKERINKYED